MSHYLLFIMIITATSFLLIISWNDKIKVHYHDFGELLLSGFKIFKLLSIWDNVTMLCILLFLNRNKINKK